MTDPTHLSPTAARSWPQASKNSSCLTIKNGVPQQETNSSLADLRWCINAVDDGLVAGEQAQPGVVSWCASEYWVLIVDGQSQWCFLGLF